MHVVILSPAALFDDGSLPLLGGDDRVTVIAWDRPTAPDGAVLLSRTSGLATRLERWAQPTMPGRVLLRLTHWDPALVFHRAVLAVPEAREALRAADLLVAPERDGGYAAWRLVHSARRAGRDLAAVFGYPAARAAIDGMR